mmetsp:Transcript_7212/g.11579  ORF Transcript_7212/g.11579 Transcript_7212/m.11579 type:complete len:81 (+) Transcript_7212:259-501(+)
MLVEQMKEAGVGQGKNSTFVVTGRTKGLYSMHTKMRRQDIEFDHVQFVIEFRIIVGDVASCHQVLVVVHSCVVGWGRKSR